VWGRSAPGPGGGGGGGYRVGGTGARPATGKMSGTRSAMRPTGLASGRWVGSGRWLRSGAYGGGGRRRVEVFHGSSLDWRWHEHVGGEKGTGYKFFSATYIRQLTDECACPMFAGYTYIRLF
jgi:hypothetical protein